MNIFEFLLPFTAVALGAMLGAVIGHFADVNIYLSALLAAYVAVLPFIVAGLRVLSKEPPQPSESPRPLENVRVQLVLIYLSIASCAGVFVLLVILSLRLRR